MSNWEKELKRFLTRYYAIEVSKGLIFFLAIGSILWLIGAYVGLALGNNVVGRGILLIILLLSLGLLAWRYWVPGLMILSGLRKGISMEEGAKLIRRWLPEAKDKLLNTIELKEKTEISSLWQEAYNQHEHEVDDLKYEVASPWKDVRKGLMWLVVPMVIALVVVISGQWGRVKQGTQRVISYNEIIDAYADMQLFWSSELPDFVVEGSSVNIDVSNSGSVQPDVLYILVNGEKRRLKNTKFGWNLELDDIYENVELEIEVGGIIRLERVIEVEQRPTLEEGQIELVYPKYLGKEKEELRIGEKVVVPRGTEIVVTGVIDGGVGSRMSNPDIEYVIESNLVNYEVFGTKNTLYSIDLKGARGTWFPGFGINIEVTNDEPPVVLDQWELRDSVLVNEHSFLDDYGLRGYRVKVNLEDNTSRTIEASSLSGVKHSGKFELNPWELGDSIQGIKSIQLVVTDNDKPNGYKTSNGAVYTWSIKSRKDEAKQQMESFGSLSDQMSRNQEEWSKRNEDLENSFQENRTSESTWKSRNELRSQADELKRESENRKARLEKRKEILKDWDKVSENQDIDDILERLDEVEKKENRRKLNELLEKMDEKKNEDLLKRLEQERKKSEEMRISEKRLDEMMKRAEVDMRYQMAIEELEELKDMQEELAEDTEKGGETATEQEELKNELKEWNKEFEEMLEKNEGLKDPFEMNDMKDSRSESSEKMEEATESSKDEQKSSDEKMKDQKESAEKLQEMLEEMQSMSSSMSQDQHSENMETLRQIQDNLLVYSQGEEQLTSALGVMVNGDPSLKDYQEDQQKLRSGAEVIQDSLRALAERVPMIKESVFSKLKRMESASKLAQEAMGEQQLGQASSESQYAMTAANELALMLDETMQQMQAQMKSMMSGKGNCSKPGGAKPNQAGMQKAQKQLMGGMKQGLSKGKGKKESKEKGEQKGSGKPGQAGEGENGMSAQEFAKLLQQQEALREMWEQMMQESESAGGGVGESKVLELMQESERELAEMKLTEKSVERQREIETRMLKSDKADRQKGQEEKRESRTGEGGMSNTRLEGSDSERENRNEIEGLIRTNPEYRNYYRELIQGWQRDL